MKFRRILVSGASGFVGLFLLERLVEQGEYEIVALHNRPLAKETLSTLRDKVRWLRADIVCDDLSTVVAGIDAVFHLAAYSSISQSSAEQTLLEQVNVVGTKRLAEVSKNAGVHHFIYVSSVAACEKSTSLDINEENGFPVTPYGRSKKAGEDLVLAMSGDGFEVTILRATALFGEHHAGSVYELAKKIDQGRFVIFGDGRNRTNFFYIRDFVDLLVTVLGNVKAYGEIFIAADQAYPLREFVYWVTSALGSKRRILHIPRWIGLGVGIIFDVVARLTSSMLPFSRRRFYAMTRNTAYINQKVVDVLGWKSKCGVRDGINRTIAWYRESGML